MPILRIMAAAGLALAALSACGEMATLPVEAGMGPTPQLPAPNPTTVPTVKTAKAVGWPPGAHPIPASGLAVTAFADGLDHPRWLYVLPNGDVLVAETNAPPKPESASGGLKDWVAGLVMKRAGARTLSANRITLLRDADHDGIAETRSVLLEGLNSPFGMALVGDWLYVANADAVVRYPYRAGQTRIDAPGEKVADLPAGINHHWTKNLIASPDGGKLYVSVGSNSNVAENGMEIEEGRAAIWEIDLASGARRLYATGLRNPVGMAWAPDGKTLWTAVNERDELGSDLVPDYMTSVRDGGFYGWPYSYFGQHVDTRVTPQRPDLVARAIVPDYALGPHTASLGLAWSGGARLPAPYTDGMFVGQHGSWNRNPRSGYKVIFVPFSQGKPDGPARDVLTGFLNESGEAQGRPVGVAIDRQGGLLVADDVGNAIWRVGAAP
ncbi:sorbosone dehydrogenase family protein [Achromobacter denitrificans]|uniref:Sorbosone dehydrogenase family protein n=1 Tax=Achromobacter denitrificans TaxID=32002 RepID=A0A6N0JFY4_ACHDE|nr:MULTISPECIES: sorbosone dehydrogenase family protein [Achromobacter]MBV2162010.1 sorbosone dehydrogenase family protein [Achromobacter denitrificans]MDF3850210.1 sorbosone dehydrogenase family protein [Achromobacter denitrificans]MDF3859893.1 sorbosone dehydrogenase family protein [Achromobacter denitrificans]MDF3940974.1 sorbosone dehydrogenase family protein [Achromobacter denitrificans]QKQ45760.1 sorbosone dehydrogenase family protein [Achromobacter denitrificans]